MSTNRPLLPLSNQFPVVSIFSSATTPSIKIPSQCCESDPDTQWVFFLLWFVCDLSVIDRAWFVQTDIRNIWTCLNPIIICHSNTELLHLGNSTIFENILFQKIKNISQGGKDQHQFELNSCRNPLEIWQKSGDCEKEIVRENLVEAIPEVGGAKSSQLTIQWTNYVQKKSFVEIQLKVQLQREKYVWEYGGSIVRTRGQLKCHGESVNQGGGGSSPGELLQNGEFRMVTERGVYSGWWWWCMVIKITNLDRLNWERLVANSYL